MFIRLYQQSSLLRTEESEQLQRPMRTNTPILIVLSSIAWFKESESSNGSKQLEPIDSEESPLARCAWISSGEIR